LIAALAVASTMFVIWFFNRPVELKKSTMADVYSEAERGGYRLIDFEKLSTLYEKHPRQILLVDTRQEWEYRSGHIARAVNFPLAPTWWARWRNKKALGKFLGADKENTLIFY
jgi:hypothetical protein